MTTYEFNVCSLDGHWTTTRVSAPELSTAWILLIQKNPNIREVKLLSWCGPRGVMYF